MDKQKRSRKPFAEQTPGLVASERLFGISPSDIADHNSRTVLGLLRRFGPLSRQDLAAHTGLTEPAVNGILNRLGAAGLAIKRGRLASGGRASVFALVPQAALAGGLSLGETASEFLILDLAGQVCWRRTIAGDVEIGGLLASAPDALGLPGVSAQSGGRSASPAGGLGIGISACPARMAEAVALSGRIGAPASVMTDTEAALMVEAGFGAEIPEGGLVVILIGQSVRAGLLVGGEIFRGVSGRAGQIGGMRSGDPPRTLDQTVSVPAFRQAMADGWDVNAWAQDAARHLLDAIVALAGFVSPGAIRVGGDLPDEAQAALMIQLSDARQALGGRFFSLPWVPTVQRTLEGRGGLALGAAFTRFTATLLPSP